MNDLLVRVRRSLERERSLVADASHELRTPFAILQGELELAQRPGRTRDELMTTMTVAAEEVARLTRIADDLLLMSRGDQGQLHDPARGGRRPGPPRRDHGTCRHPDHRARHARPGRVSLGSSGPPRPGPNEAGRGQPHRQLVAILPTRLGDRSAGRGSGSRPPARGRDDGPGFDPTFLPHAFERFRRSDLSRSRDHGGAGLGLAIVSSIVARPWGHGHRRERTSAAEPVSVSRSETPSSSRTLWVEILDLVRCHEFVSGLSMRRRMSSRSSP